jgi:hypothetical protein
MKLPALRLRHEDQPDSPEEAARGVRIAVDQLERADLYLVAAIEVGLPNAQRYELDLLRRHLLAVRDLLARPTLIREG